MALARDPAPVQPPAQQPQQFGLQIPYFNGLGARVQSQPQTRPELDVFRQRGRDQPASFDYL